MNGLLFIVIGLCLCYGLAPTVYYKWIRRNDLEGTDAAKKQIMLTFDDGPDEEYTEKLLDMLKENDTKALFFLLGDKVESNPEIVRRIAKEGHQIGLHGQKHTNMWYMGYRKTRMQFERGAAVLEKMGVSPVCYRPPYGSVNLFTVYFSKKYKLPICLWTTAVQDWKKGLSSQDVLMRLRRRAKPGDVLLLHDSGKGTGGAPKAPERMLEALHRFIPEMKEFGYTFVTSGVPLNTTENTDTAASNAKGELELAA